MKSAVTLCDVAEAAAGPFVFHGPIAEGLAKAAAHGFDAVELLLPGQHLKGSADPSTRSQPHGQPVKEPT